MLSLDPSRQRQRDHNRDAAHIGRVLPSAWNRAGTARPRSIGIFGPRKSGVAVTGEATRHCPMGQCSTGQLRGLNVRSSKRLGTPAKERHMPISQERELEIEQELAAIVRQLERRPPMEKRGSSKEPEQAVQLPMGTILLDG